MRQFTPVAVGGWLVNISTPVAVLLVQVVTLPVMPPPVLCLQKDLSRKMPSSFLMTVPMTVCPVVSTEHQYLGTLPCYAVYEPRSNLIYSSHTVTLFKIATTSHLFLTFSSSLPRSHTHSLSTPLQSTSQILSVSNPSPRSSSGSKNPLIFSRPV